MAYQRRESGLMKRGGEHELVIPGGRSTVLCFAVLSCVWLLTRLILFAQLHGGIALDGLDGLALPAHLRAGSGTRPTVHVVLTSNGNPYMNWQTRVMYATYLAAAASEPDGMLARGAFTRVLHRSTDDELMQEVPTQRFTPVHVNCDVYCSFPVADRAPALVEWAATPDAQRCSHVLLVETDHLFVKPLPETLLPPAGRALGFPFSYIVPSHPSVLPYSLKYYPAEKGPITDIPATGNAPVLLSTPDLRRLLPAWAAIVAEIEADEAAVNSLGWVRDMYAWSFAAVREGIVHDLAMPPENPLMVQPPADTCAALTFRRQACTLTLPRRALGKAAILHYTWGPVVHNSSGAVVWEARAAGLPQSSCHPLTWRRSLISAPTRGGSMRRGRASWRRFRSRLRGRRGCTCRRGLARVPRFRRLLLARAVVLLRWGAGDGGWAGADAAHGAHLQRCSGQPAGAAKGIPGPRGCGGGGTAVQGGGGAGRQGAARNCRQRGCCEECQGGRTKMISGIFACTARGFCHYICSTQSSAIRCQGVAPQ